MREKARKEEEKKRKGDRMSITSMQQRASSRPESKMKRPGTVTKKEGKR